LAKLTIAQLDLAGRRVFVRADLNAPLDHGAVSDDTRLRAVVPTIQHALKAGASVVLASHLGRPKGKVVAEFSLRPIAERLHSLLAQPVELAPDCVGPATLEKARVLAPGQVLLLENLRFHPEEEANDDGFVRALAELAECYVDDAFAAAHRAHASIAAITKHLQPAAAGLLMQQELSALGRILESPQRPLVAILGGAKVSDKLTLVEHLLEKVDALLIGGGMAFTFLRALGHAVGRSLVEADQIETARHTLDAARRRGVALVLPVDAVVADGLDSAQGRTVGIREIPAGQMGLDIGPRTVERFTAALGDARTIVWNGPMGVFEKPAFAAGTLALARAVAKSSAFTVIGGGDTVAAVTQAGVADQIGYISTAGGAFLEFLEG
jgi:phosphoglycerate kinase